MPANISNNEILENETNQGEAMSYATKIVTAAIGIVMLASVGPYAVKQFEIAHVANGANDLANVGSLQQFSIATDGLFAPSLASLTDGSLGGAITPSHGASIGYAVTTDRKHYLAAERMPGGRVIVTDGQHTATCPAYGPACVHQVTSSPELIDAVPEWANS